MAINQTCITLDTHIVQHIKKLSSINNIQSIIFCKTGISAIIYPTSIINIKYEIYNLNQDIIFHYKTLNIISKIINENSKIIVTEHNIEIIGNINTNIPIIEPIHTKEIFYVMYKKINDTTDNIKEIKIENIQNIIEQIIQFVTKIKTNSIIIKSYNKQIIVFSTDQFIFIAAIINNKNNNNIKNAILLNLNNINLIKEFITKDKSNIYMYENTIKIVSETTTSYIYGGNDNKKLIDKAHEIIQDLSKYKKITIKTKNINDCISIIKNINKNMNKNNQIKQLIITTYQENVIFSTEENIKLSTNMDNKIYNINVEIKIAVIYLHDIVSIKKINENIEILFLNNENPVIIIISDNIFIGFMADSIEYTEDKRDITH